MFIILYYIDGPASPPNPKRFAHLPYFLQPGYSESDKPEQKSPDVDSSNNVPSTWTDSMDDFVGSMDEDFGSGSSDYSDTGS